MSESGLSCWYEARTDEAMAQAIDRHAEYLWDKQSSQRAIDEVHAVLYRNRHRFSGSAAGALAVLQHGGRQPLKLNVVRSMIETLGARIAQDFPLVHVAADGAEWSYKLRARRMTRFITTKQEETGFRRIAPLVFRDACVRGTGIVKVTSHLGEIVHDRVPKRELLVDELEARYGEAWNVHRVWQWSRERLAAMFPRHRTAIMTTSDDGGPWLRDEIADWEGYERDNLITVIESHHLPSSPDADDGVHAISIRGRVIHRGEWKRQRLPYSFLHWSPPDEGFWGTGLAEELAPIQFEIDQTMKTLSEGFRLGAPLKVFLQRQSKIIKTQLVPLVGAIVECSGAPPEIRAPSNPVSDQQIRWVMQLVQSAYEIAGISQLAAMGKKPGSLESGEALEVFHDFETERFQHVEAQYQNLALDCAEREIDEAKDIYGSKTKDGEPLHRDFHAKWVNRDVIEKIDWGSVDMTRDSFKLRLRPVNYITGTQAGKLDRAVRFAKAGLVPPQWLLPLFDSPDLERFTRLQTAMFNYAEWTVEKLMDNTANMPQPNSVADLEFLETHVKAGLLDSIADGAPDTVLKRFMSYLSNVSAKKQKAAAAVAPAPMAALPMGAGPLPPGPPPMTMEGNALPNAPGAIAA